MHLVVRNNVLPPFVFDYFLIDKQADDKPLKSETIIHT